MDFIKTILSDSSNLSHKRFLGIQSFYLIFAIALVALSHRDYKLQNFELLLQIEEHLFYIVIFAFFITGSENIVKIITSKNKIINTTIDTLSQTPDEQS
jgi:UDP-N-acetylmuramyl pentapeptide phosphotransferase/UDP-N-acetylglucosamine-1-phosphate transferase